MSFVGLLSSALGGYITPFALALTSSVLLITRKRGKSRLASVDFGKKEGGTTPFRALTLALAGTLGVGNITGVTSALISGGPGAVFWMWIGALSVYVIKYAEVSLAVKYRRRDKTGYTGGAMYYIRDGLGEKAGYKLSSRLGGVFALLCVSNSLITGNIVQSNAAASVFPNRAATGIVLGVLLLLSILYGTRKIEKITSFLIPPLALLYVLVSLYFILSNISLVGEVLRDIFTSAFSFRSIYGGALGFSVREAVRFGVMRGIFSNEAGCGTSPTAHASADAKSPHAQGILGIIEVVFDTLILCTLTAVVMLIADRKYSCIPWAGSSDAARVTLDAFSLLGGEVCGGIISVSIVLFAYASILAQLYYGSVALGYLSDRRAPMRVYYALSVLCAVIGSVIPPELMWSLADIILGVMTVFNCTVLILLRRESMTCG